MGVDYIIDHLCSGKEAMGTETMLQLIKCRNQAEAALQAVREDGDDRPPSEIAFVRSLTTAEGVVERQANVQELFDEAGALEPHKEECRRCPANAVNAPFGCIGYVPFPIQPVEEEWLLSRLPHDAGSTAGCFLWKALADFKYDGGPVSELRRQEDTFFVLDETPVRKYRGLLSRKKVSADQVWQMLFFVGHLQPPHCVLLCLLLGLSDPNLDPDKMAEMMTNPPIRAGVLQPVSVGDDLRDYVANIAEFLNAVRTAAVLDVPLLVEA